MVCGALLQLASAAEDPSVARAVAEIPASSAARLRGPSRPEKLDFRPSARL
jgi:hypothetical protein